MECNGSGTLALVVVGAVLLCGVLVFLAWKLLQMLVATPPGRQSESEIQAASSEKSRLPSQPSVEVFAIHPEETKHNETVDALRMQAEMQRSHIRSQCDSETAAKPQDLAFTVLAQSSVHQTHPLNEDHQAEVSQPPPNLQSSGRDRDEPEEMENPGSAAQPAIETIQVQGADSPQAAHNEGTNGENDEPKQDRYIVISPPQTIPAPTTVVPAGIVSAAGVEGIVGHGHGHDDDGDDNCEGGGIVNEDDGLYDILGAGDIANPGEFVSARDNADEFARDPSAAIPTPIPIPIPNSSQKSSRKSKPMQRPKQNKRAGGRSDQQQQRTYSVEDVVQLPARNASVDFDDNQCVFQDDIIPHPTSARAKTIHRLTFKRASVKGPGGF